MEIALEELRLCWHPVAWQLGSAVPEPRSHAGLYGALAIKQPMSTSSRLGLETASQRISVLAGCLGERFSLVVLSPDSFEGGSASPGDEIADLMAPGLPVTS